MLHGEHGVLLLKPDGVAAGLENQLPSYFSEYNLHVIATHKFTLSREDVVKNIRTPFDIDEYCGYLCSGPVLAILVEGDYAINKLIKIKRHIRGKHGVTCDDMMNYVHSADLGNEHYIHIDLLFPEFDKLKYSLYADMNVKVTPNNWCTEISKIEKKSNVSYIGLIAEAESLLKLQETTDIISNEIKILYGIRFRCRDEDLYEKEFYIIGYFFHIPDNLDKEAISSLKAKKSIELIHIFGGTAILDYMPYRICKSEILLQKMKDAGLDGIVVYDIRYSQNEVARLEYIAADVLGLLLSGGSNGVLESGSLSIDKITFDLFIDKMIINQKSVMEDAN